MQGVTAVVSNSNIFTDSIKNELVNQGQSLNNSESKVNFSDVINNAIEKVNDIQVNADEKVEGLIKGENVSMHEVMLSMQEAQMSMQLMIEVRNKVYEAYQEVNRVQL